jgi:uncharacterized membrane protein (UPF0182 family)
VLVAFLFLLLAVHYRLAMFGLLRAHHGAVFGAGFTDLNARMPANWILLVLCAALGLGLLANGFAGRREVIPGAAVAWVLTAVLAGGVYPSIVQGIQVSPSEVSQERPYLAREIEATNRAFGLDQVTTREFTNKQKVDGDLFAANPGTMNNLRLWDYSPLKTAYQGLESLRTYYDFHDVDIDRYALKDGYRQVMISARELSPDNLPQNARTWVNLHMRYTHGYGAAATPVSQVGPEGKPAFVLQSIPPAGELGLDRPQVYFGETAKLDSYVAVNATDPEFDYQSGDKEAVTRWKGTSGVALGSAPQRLAFALRFGDLNLFLSSQLNADSQLLFHRNIAERIATLAPFLSLDHDPYIAISNGKMYWIQDAYTTSDQYPYSEPAQLQATGETVNYIRNSVKVVIDAYDGTPTFYTADSKDPLLATYARIFPGVFHPIDEMPADLRAHVRYPEDLFNVQAQQLQTFHMHDPSEFYNKSDAWAIPTEIRNQGASQVTLQPYYVLMRIPGEQKEEFVLIQPYTPLNKKNMVAWVAARSDGANYGKLLNFRFPTDVQVTGPGQVESRIDQDLTISRDFTLLNSQGSRVLRGNLLVIPLGDALIFVEPVFTEATSGQPQPELKKVIVADQDRVAYADTLQQALAQLLGAAPPVSTPTGTVTTPSTDLKLLIKQVQDRLDSARAKLKSGDLAGYAADVEQARTLAASASGAKPSPSPSPSR